MKRSALLIGLALALTSSAALAANAPYVVPGVASGSCTSWPQCPVVPNDATHPWYFAPSTGSSFTIGNFPGSFSLSGTLPAFASTPTFNLGTLNGASTAANQTAVQSAPGTPQTTAVTVQGNASGVPVPIISGATTAAGPDVSSVTTGGVAVTAFSAGHCARGCILINPKGAMVDLCVNGTGTAASGTTTSGALVCIPPGQQYGFTARATAISAVSSDSSHAFGGEGYQ